MKNNRINLRLLCALSSILLVSNGLQAMSEVENNVEKLLKTRECADCNFFNANLEGKNLAGVNLIDANLVGANLEGANLRNSNLKNTNFKNANLKNANLKNANLRNANIANTNFKGANLEGADLKSATNPVIIADENIINSGAKLNNTTLPSGKNYSK